MNFPHLCQAKRLELLEPPTGPVRMVLDTDTYNEVDDQFAVCHAVLSPETLDLEAIYAAPFHNRRSSNPGDGMEKSYREILTLLDLLNVDADGLVFRGSDRFLEAPAAPVASDAARDLVAKAMSGNERPLYVLAIGAITNVASAILMEPRIIEHIVVVWLGGKDHHHRSAIEFNLKQDPHASRLIFDCGVPFVHIPCHNVASHLITTVPELNHYLKGRNAISDYLADIVAGYVADGDPYAWSKVIWDIATTSYLISPSWVPTTLGGHLGHCHNQLPDQSLVGPNHPCAKPDTAAGSDMGLRRVTPSHPGGHLHPARPDLPRPVRQVDLCIAKPSTKRSCGSARTHAKDEGGRMNSEQIASKTFRIHPSSLYQAQIGA